MGLKITTQIGTDKGITNQAYVRISNYHIYKNGSASFGIELYESPENAPDYNGDASSYNNNLAQNQQIGSNFTVLLTKEIQEEITYPILGNDSNGNPLPDRVETITKTVPDLTLAEGVDIFTFGYSKLKVKLIELFGESNVVDC